MNTINFQFHKTHYGELIIGSIENKLCICDWRYRKMRSAIDQRLEKFYTAQFRKAESDTIKLTIDQLDEYFNYQRKKFEIPLALAGSEFQQAVWKSLIEVPFGKTVSYQQLADKIGNRKAVRAVAGANGANAISIIVPCHRVIGKNGTLTGYAGGLQTKKKLLALEQNLYS